MFKIVLAIFVFTLIDIYSRFPEQNKFSGPLPAEIHMLSGLKQLILSKYVIRGFSSWKQDSNLFLFVKTLDDNRLSGSLPTEVANLENLSVLQLSESNTVGFTSATSGHND